MLLVLWRGHHLNEFALRGERQNSHLDTPAGACSDSITPKSYRQPCTVSSQCWSYQVKMNVRRCGTRVVKSAWVIGLPELRAVLLAVRGRLRCQRNIISFVSILEYPGLNACNENSTPEDVGSPECNFCLPWEVPV